MEALRARDAARHSTDAPIFPAPSRPMIDDVVAEDVQNWATEVYEPMLNKHRDDFYNQYWQELEDTKPALLQVCEEGKRCREQNERDIYERVVQEWETSRDAIRQQVENTIRLTKRTVQQGWEKHVKCEIDHPCCTVDEVTIHNLHMEVHRIRDKIIDFQTKWQLLEHRRVEIEVECADVHEWPECGSDQLSPCPDGQARLADTETCECPDYGYPMCPEYLCWDDSARNPKDCSCPERPDEEFEWCLTSGSLLNVLKAKNGSLAYQMLTSCPDRMLDLHETDIKLNQSMHFAAAYGFVDVVKELNNQGVDVNVGNISHDTPLRLASKVGKEEAVYTLLLLGADPNLANIDGATALTAAAGFNRLEIARLLLEYGAEINHLNKWGRNALYYADIEGYTEVADFLISEGSDRQAQATEEQ